MLTRVLRTAALLVLCLRLLSVSITAQETSSVVAREDNETSLVEAAQRLAGGLVLLPSNEPLFGARAAFAARAQPDEEIDESQLAARSQNPVGDLVSQHVLQHRRE